MKKTSKLSSKRLQKQRRQAARQTAVVVVLALAVASTLSWVLVTIAHLGK